MGNLRIFGGCCRHTEKILLSRFLSSSRLRCIQRQFSILLKILYWGLKTPSFQPKTMSVLYTNGLDSQRQNYFNEKIPQFANDFVLAGGTAIMLQLDHRKSFDFDLFSQKPLQDGLIRKCKEIFGKDIDVQTDTSDLLLFTTADGIKVGFVYYPYPPQHKLVEDGPINLFSLRDLAGDKARTVGRRATWRDYVDLFFFLKWEMLGLEEMINEAEARFEGEFNDKLFLGQLSYFEDFKITPTEFLQEEYSPQEIQEFLIKEAEKYTQKRLTGD